MCAIQRKDERFLCLHPLLDCVGKPVLSFYLCINILMCLGLSPVLSQLLMNE